MKKITPFFCLFLFFISTAFAEDTTAHMARVMTEAGFTEQQVIRVQSMISTAHQKGLPEEAMTGKVYEGIAKRVAPEKIVQAMERVTSRYEFGNILAGKLVRERKQVTKLGATVAAGLAAGLTRQDAEKLVDGLKTRARHMKQKELHVLAEETMRTARDLARQGVSSKTTTEAVVSALQKGFDASAMYTMRSSFAQQEAQGNFESLAKNYGAAIDQGIGAQDLAEHGTASRESSGIQGDEKGAGGESSGSDDSSGDSGSEGSDGSGDSGSGDSGSGGSGDSGSGDGGSSGSGGSGDSGSGDGGSGGSGSGSGSGNR